MLPHNHFIIAGLVIAPVALIAGQNPGVDQLGLWIAAGGLASVLVDLDVVALVYLRAAKEDRLKPYRNPVKIFTKFKEFMRIIADCGLLKTAMQTHFLLSAILLLLVYCFGKDLIIPVALGVISHLVSDIPNILRRRSETQP
ncbi:MAG: hypothetical protein KKE17_03360 [Proteobacteria bacterium]|nr:hypothetical protein [Pseudomonadota bacterium]MBU1709022.1 hypothetical protein [Pseudomonadota bacterium]